MTIGGYNSTLHMDEVEYTPLYESNMYSVNLRTIFIENTQLPLK